MNKIYLAVPYWHEDPKVRQDRFERVNIKAGELMQKGYVVFSPISHSHPIGETMEQKNHVFWLYQDFPMLEACDQLWILALEGWEQSIGVYAEIRHALKCKMPIKIEY